MFCKTFSGRVKGKQVLHGIFAYFIALGEVFSTSLPYIFALHSSICCAAAYQMHLKLFVTFINVFQLMSCFHTDKLDKGILDGQGIN